MILSLIYEDWATTLQRYLMFLFAYMMSLFTLNVLCTLYSFFYTMLLDIVSSGVLSERWPLLMDACICDA